MESNEEFRNQVILPDQLTPIEDQEFVGLENKYKRLKHIYAVIFLIVSLGAFLLFSIFSSTELPVFALIIVPSLVVLIFIWRFVIIFKSFPIKGYLLREHDVSYRSGLLMYKLTSIPFNRIQHVEVSQNMVEKNIGLSKVKIFTAGGSISDLSIPGLLPEKAQQIESFLLSKASLHE